MPWIAIVTAARGGPLYRLNASRNDVGADLSAAVLLPGFALAMRALLDTRVYDWEKLFMLAIVATALCVLLMVALVREVRADTAVIGVVSVIMLAYGYGVVGLANMQLDRNEPTIYPTRVLGAHVSSGKTTSHYLKLGPWGPNRTAEDVEVDKDYYETGSRRETVCVYLFPGALGARWYVVWDCRA